MRLFNLDQKSYQVIVEPAALLLEPFNKIYKRDRSKGKTRANQELAFVYFYTDIKSDFLIYTDLEQRKKVISKDLKLPENWKIDKDLQEAIDYYKERSTSIAAKILEDSTYVANKVTEGLRAAVDEELDVGELDKVINGLKKIPDVIKALKVAEEQVLKEIEQAQDKLGSKEKAMFEDGQLYD